MMNYASLAVRFSRNSFGLAIASSDEPSYISSFFDDFKDERTLDRFIAHVDSNEEWGEPGNYIQIDGTSSQVEMYPYPDKVDFFLHPSQFRALLVDFKEFSKSDRESDYREYPAPAAT